MATALATSPPGIPRATLRWLPGGCSPVEGTATTEDPSTRPDGDPRSPESTRVEPIVRLGASSNRSLDVAAVVAAAFDEHAPRLNAFARSAVRDPATAEDLVQETFLRLVRQLQADRAPDDVSRWLFRVCGNLIVSRARRRSVAARWAAHLVDRSHAESPEDETLRHDRDRILGVALGRMPADARVALLLAARGIGSAEIAAAIGRTPGATRTFLSRSRLDLRRILADLGVESR